MLPTKMSRQICEKHVTLVYHSLSSINVHNAEHYHYHTGTTDNIAS